MSITHAEILGKPAREVDGIALLVMYLDWHHKNPVPGVFRASNLIAAHRRKMSDGQTIQLINFSRELRNIWRRMTIAERRAVIMQRPNTEAEIKAAMEAVKRQRTVNSEQ